MLFNCFNHLKLLCLLNYFRIMLSNFYQNGACDQIKKCIKEQKPLFNQLIFLHAHVNKNFPFSKSSHLYRFQLAIPLPQCQHIVQASEPEVIMYLCSSSLVLLELWICIIYKNTLSSIIAHIGFQTTVALLGEKWETSNKNGFILRIPQVLGY